VLLSPVQLFGDQTELDDEVLERLLRFGLSAFLSPEAEKGLFVVPHSGGTATG
jgi:hypothetical protein